MHQAPQKPNKATANKATTPGVIRHGCFQYALLNRNLGKQRGTVSDRRGAWQRRPRAGHPRRCLLDGVPHVQWATTLPKGELALGSTTAV